MDGGQRADAVRSTLISCHQAPNYYLQRLVDCDGKEATLSYITITNATTYETYRLLSQVDMPYGKSASLQYYGDSCDLAQITDAAGMSSSFGYDYCSTNFFGETKGHRACSRSPARSRQYQSARANNRTGRTD